MQDHARATRLNAALAVAWTLLALWRLPTHGHFLYDEAFFWQRALAVVRSHLPAGYGPYVSGTSPMLFTPGGGAFDLLAVGQLFTSNPLAGAVWVVLLAAGGLVFFDRALAKLEVAPEARVAAMVLYAFGIWHFRMTDRIWNVDLFHFASPLLLFLAATAATSVTAARPETWRRRCAAGVLLGMAAGLCLQIHLSGSMAIALAGLAVLPRLRRLPRRELLALGAFALVGLLAAYVPYVVVDAAHGFANTHHLGGGRTNPGAFGVASGRSLATFFQFTSQSDPFRPERFPGDLRGELGTLTFFVAIAATLAGALRRSPLQLMALGGLLVPPAFFAVTGRDYLAHYAVAGAPFYVLPAAVLFGGLLRSRWRALSAVYLAFFLGLGVVDLFAEYSDDAAQWTLSDQLAIAGALSDRASEAHLVSGSLLDWQAPLYGWLAKDVLGRSLSMSGGMPCGIYDTETEALKLGRVPVLAGRHWVVCGASR